MTEVLEKIQSILKEAKTFALFSKNNSEEYKLLAKEALKCALLKKNFTIFSFPENPDFQKKWSSLLSNAIQPLSQQTSIRIPKNQYKIKELKYEDDNDFLSLVLTSENGELKKENIVFEPVAPKIDTAFCFFSPPENEFFEGLGNKVLLPEKEKIIFLTSSNKTFAEKIFRIIKLIDSEILSVSTVPNFLLASLLDETQYFADIINQEILSFASELLSYGADKEKINEILKKKDDVVPPQLLGRALARTYYDEPLGAYWTFLSQKDFEKTNTTETTISFLYSIIQKIRKIISSQNLSLLLWQNGKNVSAMAAGDNEEKLAQLANCFGVKLQSKFFTIGPFNNFSEAENALKKALREAMSPSIKL